MSEWQSGRRTPTWHRLAALGGGAAVIGLLAGLGVVWPGQSAGPESAHVALVGRTTTVCVPGTGDGDAKTNLTAAAMLQGEEREGRLSAGLLITGAQPLIDIDEQGHGKVLEAVTKPIQVNGDGAMATATVSSLVSTATEGPRTGLLATACAAPGVEHWFVGVDTRAELRSTLELTNPDAASAEVDLRFYGRTGRVIVPGSPGVVVDAQSTLSVAFDTLLSDEGPLTVEVRASTGRVAAVVETQASSKLDPVGADWQAASTEPANRTVIAGIPEGSGSRTLIVANPGTQRATVSVEALGLAGPYVPLGAETLELLPESTAELDLTAGMLGEAGAVRLTSDQPVTGAVRSGSSRDEALPDISFQSATSALLGSGMSAVATVEGVDTDVVLSNSGETEAQVEVEAFSMEGVSLETESVLLTAGATATRRLTAPAPSYLVVRVPDGSAVHGGVVLTQPDGDVAGLATIALTSPDIASRAPEASSNPSVGR